MRVIIAGSRHFAGETAIDVIYQLIELRLFPFHDCHEVVCGCAEGVDQAGKEWARRADIPVKNFPADWDKHGKAAGPIRNREMAAYADFAVVIWDGKSRGSANMLDEMRRAGKPALSWIVR